MSLGLAQRCRLSSALLVFYRLTGLRTVTARRTCAGPLDLFSANSSLHAVFDEDNLVSCAGLVPVMALAEQAGLSELLANKIHIAAPRVKSGSANPAPKLATLIAGMCAGADYIDDVDLVRAAGMKALFRAGVCPVNGGNSVAGVHFRSCPPVGFGAGRASGRLV